MTQHRWELAAKARPVAADVLEKIWQTRREELLPQLLAGLPRLAWSCLRISPADHALAGEFAKELPLQQDPDLAGGFVAECRERDLIVDCSLETLLKRIWPQISAELLARIADEHSEPGA